MNLLSSSWQSFALAGTLALEAALLGGGCALDRRGLGSGDGGSSEVDGGGGDEGGMGGDGGHGGDAALPPIGPNLTLPINGAALSPSEAHLSWRDGVIPSGLTVTGYELCSAASLADIDDASECPNPQVTTRRRFLMNLLSSGQTVFWKVRARFDDGSSSADSVVRQFTMGGSPLARWPMDGDAMDVSGANHGTLQNGAGFGAGFNGQALHVNASGSQYVDAGGGLALPGPLTVSVWVYANAIPSVSDTGIMSQGGLSYALTYHSDGRIYFYINNGGNNLNIPMGAAGWHLVTGTFNGTTELGGMKLYLDGAEVGSRASGSATTGAMGAFWFGRYETSYFDGRLDEAVVEGAAWGPEAVLNEFCVGQAESGADPLPLNCDP